MLGKRGRWLAEQVSFDEKRRHRALTGMAKPPNKRLQPSGAGAIMGRRG